MVKIVFYLYCCQFFFSRCRDIKCSIEIFKCSLIFTSNPRLLWRRFVGVMLPKIINCESYKRIATSENLRSCRCSPDLGKKSCHDLLKYSPLVLAKTIRYPKVWALTDIASNRMQGEGDRKKKLNSSLNGECTTLKSLSCKQGHSMSRIYSKSLIMRRPASMP